MPAWTNSNESPLLGFRLPVSYRRSTLSPFHKVINPIHEDFTLIANYLPKAPPLIIIILEVKISKQECGDTAFSLKNIMQPPSSPVLRKHR